MIRPGKFAGTESFYSLYRSGYPRGLIERVAALMDLSRSSRVLDLGCGPATLACAFSPFVGEVIGLDPEAGMIEEGRRVCQIPNVKLKLGGSFDLTGATGKFDLVAIGRAFHWMDRDDVLIRLDGKVTAGGAVALFSAPRVKAEENRWREDFDRVIAEFAPEDYTKTARMTEPGVASHESILLRSAFPHLERIGLIVRGRLSVDDAVGRAFFMGGTSPAVLGDRVVRFEEALRAALEPHLRDGALVEITEPQALVARQR
jgi:SAM-dependent methyltransferase